MFIENIAMNLLSSVGTECAKPNKVQTFRSYGTQEGSG